MSEDPILRSVKYGLEKEKQYAEQIRKCLEYVRGIVETINSIDEFNVRASLLHVALDNIASSVNVPAVIIVGILEYLKYKYLDTLLDAESLSRFILNIIDNVKPIEKPKPPIRKGLDMTI